MTDKDVYKELDALDLKAYKLGWVIQSNSDNTVTPRPLRVNEKIEKFEKMLKEEKK